MPAAHEARRGRSPYPPASRVTEREAHPGAAGCARTLGRRSRPSLQCLSHRPPLA
jgi:hypothetical protein